MRSISRTDDRFADAVQGLSSVTVRPEFILNEAPAPQRLAPSTVAMTAEMADPESDLVSGRFVLLHDPDGVDEWDGSFRAVAFVRAELESEFIEEPLLHDVGWSWVTEVLALRQCHARHIGGTVTRTLGRSFGTMHERPSDGYIEIRASWTPEETPDGATRDDLAEHVAAWLDLMAQAAGLPPVPEGVVSVDSRRPRTRS